MKRHSLSFSLALLAASTIWSCTGGTETGNPLDSSSLALHTSDPSQVSVGTGGVQNRVTSAWLSVGSIDFVIGTDCAAPGGEVEFEEPFRAELVDVASNYRTLDFDQGPLCSLELDTVVATTPLPAGAPAELLGNALLVTGVTAGGIPFELQSADGVSWEATADTPFSFQSDRSDWMVVTFDVAAWFDGIDLDALVVGMDGVISINDVDNADALDRFNDNLARSLLLARDENGNGVFDPGETVLATP